jgi:hypothetical protein
MLFVNRKLVIDILSSKFLLTIFFYISCEANICEILPAVIKSMFHMFAKKILFKTFKFYIKKLFVFGIFPVLFYSLPFVNYFLIILA